MKFELKKKLNIILSTLLVLTMLPISQVYGQSNEGHGDSEVGKKLHEAQFVAAPKIINKVSVDDPAFNYSPKVKQVFEQNKPHMVHDLQSIKLTLIGTDGTDANMPIKDIKNHYTTWLALSDDKTRIIYDPKMYEQLVRVVPQTSIMVEYLLHELGHFYNLEEDDAVEFSRILIYASQRAPVSTSKDPQNLSTNIEVERQQIEEILTTKFQVITREKIAEIKGSIDGSLSGSMHQTSPLSMAAFGGLLGGALGGGAGFGLAALASLPFIAISGPFGLLAPALIGAGIGGVTGAATMADQETGSGSISGQLHGTIEGSEYQTFATPTLFTTAVVDTTKSERVKGVMDRFTQVGPSDCTYAAINIILKMGQSPTSLSLAAMNQFTNLIRQYNSNLDALRLLQPHFIQSQPNVATSLRGFINDQDNWRLTKRLVIVNLKYDPATSIGRCKNTNDDALKAITKASVSYETYLPLLDRINSFGN